MKHCSKSSLGTFSSCDQRSGDIPRLTIIHGFGPRAKTGGEVIFARRFDTGVGRHRILPG
ncbi:hypothetical protein TMO_a0139 (plasmid) [Tistrella mobilis KA081020-065]|uniref:Uncharacterized protein n=1 Tax=Tistrella mobilis (strain KA081020-065) TaxID=1110502 RepID=I3TS04_TISMK|nr:hypothetical protein TMO_a0139 [Tistrella mobilis KA081020-065]